MGKKKIIKDKYGEVIEVIEVDEDNEGIGGKVPTALITATIGALAIIIAAIIGILPLGADGKALGCVVNAPIIQSIYNCNGNITIPTSDMNATQIALEKTQDAIATVLVTLTQVPTNSPTVTAILTSTSTPTSTKIPTVVPTLIPTSAPTSPPIQGFDFESGTQNWNTTEGQFKLAELTTASNPVHSGNSSLRLDTELYGNREDVYRHTEATAYFDNAVPLGFDRPGPHDLTGKLVTCYVYFPRDYIESGENLSIVRLFAKDIGFRNDYGDVLSIDSSNVDQWMQINMIIGDERDADGDFDSTLTNAIGVRIQAEAAIEFNGSIYIDDCSIES